MSIMFHKNGYFKFNNKTCFVYYGSWQSQFSGTCKMIYNLRYLLPLEMRAVAGLVLVSGVDIGIAVPIKVEDTLEVLGSWNNCWGGELDSLDDWNISLWWLSIWCSKLSLVLKSISHKQQTNSEFLIFLKDMCNVKTQHNTKTLNKLYKKF